MRYVRKYSAFILMMLFCCYYLGISMFSHAHIVNGASVVHSHFGGGSDHNHSENQYALIDLLSDFQSENPVLFGHIEAPYFLLSESIIIRNTPAYISGVPVTHSLRGPPQS